jgi:hypothetical protein
MAYDDPTPERENDDGPTTYYVPITAHGGVYVVADNEEAAIEEALHSVDSGELETSRDVDLERVWKDEPYARVLERLQSDEKRVLDALNEEES